MATANQHPEQKARDNIDQMLQKAGWVIQDKNAIDFSAGVITRFTDGADPQPRSREVFNFHRPDTLANWLRDTNSLRARLQALPPSMPKCTNKAAPSTCLESVGSWFNGKRQ